MRAARRELVGRRTELGLLEVALNRTSAGLQLVLISGAAGMGKSALAARAAAVAASSGAKVLVGECAREDSARPFGPFRQMSLFAGLLEESPWLSRSLLGSGAAERHRLFAQAADRLQMMAQAAPVVLVIEDLQWADQESLLLVSYLPRRCAETRVLLLATYRLEEETAAPLAATLAELRARGAQEIELPPLTVGQVGSLGQLLLGTPDRLEGPLRAFLAERSGGNPLFVEELVRALGKGGWLVRSDGTWRSAGPLGEAVLPTSVGAGVRSRLSVLPADARDVLVRAAVIGRRFAFDLLLPVAGRSRHAVIQALRAGVQAQLIEEHAVNEISYVFRHALYRDALLGELLAPERQDLHRAVGLALEEATSESDRSAVAGDLAYHFDAAGDRERAVRYHLLAARATTHGAALGDLVPVAGSAGAAQHLDRALALAPADHPDRAEMLRTYAWAQGDPLRRGDLLAEARAHSELVGDARGVALATILDGAWRIHRGDHDGLRMLRDAVRDLDGVCDPVESAAALHQLARFAALAGEHDAIDLARRAVDQARSAGPEILAHALITLGTALIRERRGEGIPVIREGHDLARRHGAPYAEMRGATNLWTSLLNSGAGGGPEIKQVERELDETIAQLGHSETTFDLMLLKLFIDDRWDDALALNAEMSFPPFDQSEVPLMVTSYIDLARQGPGSLANATTASSGLARYASGPIALLPEMLWLAGDLHGTLEAAERLVAPALTGRTTFFVDSSAIAALAAAVEIEDPVSVTRWLELCETRHDVESRRAVARRAYAKAERHRAQGRTADALEGFADAAEAAMSRGGTLLARSLPRLRRAELLLLSDPPAARRELSLAAMPWRAVGAAWSLRRLRAYAAARGARGWAAPSGPHGALTEREREVARLVADGLTDKQVATRLVISARTAESHLRRIREKLAVRSRVQVARWAAEHL